MDQGNGTFKGATRELTVDRVAHVPNLGRHSLLSTKRLTTAFDAPMRVYPAAATIRPRFGCKTLVFRSLCPETGFLEIKARRRADMKEPQTPLTAARSIVNRQGDHNPSTSWRYAGPSASCSASILTTRDKPFASATSPPAKSSCVRRPHGTPQPKRQFSVTRRLKGGGGGGGATRALFAATQDNLPLHVLTGEPGSRFEGAGIGTVWTEESGWVGRCI